MYKKLVFVLPVLVLAALPFWGAVDQLPADGPEYTPDGQLKFPQNYRDWVFLTSGLGMTYGVPGAADAEPKFDNVFVNVLRQHLSLYIHIAWILDGNPIFLDFSTRIKPI